MIDDTSLRDFFDPARYLMARNEVEILFREGDRDILRRIDRLVLRETEIILIDYKTHARVTAENTAQLADLYTDQMRQYGAGVRLLWPQKKIRLMLLFTACGGLVELTP